MGKAKIFMVALIAIALISFFAISSMAATRTITLNWTQEFDDPNAPNADYFTVFWALEGYGYAELVTVPFIDVQSVYEYTYQYNFDAGAVTTINYYITMTNLEGVTTGQSNEKSVTVDLTPDNSPVQLDPIVTNP